jgi:hypothetical protein
MDAGLAAVLGALAGSVATIGAALATGWAQRESVRITARSEHRRERREPRQTVYGEFISLLFELRNVVAPLAVVTDDGFTDQVNQIPVDQCVNLADRIVGKSIDVALSGPAEVTRRAGNLQALGFMLAVAVRAVQERFAEDGWETEHRRTLAHSYLTKRTLEYQNSLNEFVVCAQAALDDDGTL